MRTFARLATLLAIPLLAAGCLTTRDVLVGSTWTLAQVHGAPPAADATVSFEGDGTFTVRTGCNTVGGSYHLDGNRILLDTVQQSMVACKGDVAEQEAAVLAVVKGSPVYSIDTGTGQLRLTSGANQVLLFEP